jgi:magnesium-transporting ATPase (P-type)
MHLVSVKSLRFCIKMSQKVLQSFLIFFIETPLQMKLEDIAQDIGKFGFISAIVIVIVLVIRFSTERVISNHWESKHLKELLNYFIIGITVLEVVIPKGLPLAVTLSLAYSFK